MVNEIRIVSNKIEFEDNDLGAKRTLKELADRSVVFKYRRIGLYYPCSRIGGTAYATLAAPQNQIDISPFIVPIAQNFDRIAIRVTTGVAGNCRLGIYADDGDVCASTLILDAGEVDTTTTGVKEIIIAQTLTPGLYWLASLLSASGVSLNGIPIASVFPVGMDSSLTGSEGTGWRKAQAYGNLPDPFGTPDSLRATDRLAIFLRRAI